VQHEIDWDVVSIEVDEEKCGTGKIALIEGAIQVLSPGKRDRRDRGRSHHAIGMRLASQLFEPAAYELCSDGAEIARVGGTANSLAMKLGAYLDLASGRVDRTTAARRATTHDVVGDRTAEESSSASRNLYAAEQLIAAGRFDDAKPILGRMLAQL